MTYEEILKYIQSLQGSQIPYESMDTFDPNATTPTATMRAPSNINWGAVPGFEQFYSYDQANNQERIDPRAAEYAQQQGYQMMRADDQGGQAIAEWLRGPDGQDIAQSARITGTNDDRFKLAAALAAAVAGGAAYSAAGAGGVAGGGGAAGSGGGGLLGGGEAAAASGAAANAAPAMNMAMIESGLGTAGYGYNAGAAASGLFNPATIGSGAGLMFGAGGELLPYAADTVSAMTAGDVAAKTAGTNVVKDVMKAGSGLLGDPLKAAIVAGSALAGTKPSAGETTTQQSKTDPRVDPYIYGDDGVLKAAQDFYKKNKTPNANQQAGWNLKLGLLQDPATMAGLKGLQTGAQGLLGVPMMGNGWNKFYGGG